MQKAVTISRGDQMKLEVLQSRGVLRRDRVVGTLIFRNEEVVSSNGQWNINGYFDLKTTKEIMIKNQIPNLGRIYLQCKFIRKGQGLGGLEPIQNLGFPVEGRRDKFLKLKVVYCKDLNISDSFLTGSSSDPYVVISFSDGKKFKTTIKKSCLNPIYNESFM